MSEGLIPSPPQLCSHVCQLHCLLMLMRILSESIFLVIHILPYHCQQQRHPTKHVISDSFNLTITKFYTRCELMTTNENPWHVPYVSKRAKKIYFLNIYSVSYIDSKSLARAICVNKPNKKIMICASDASSACRSVGIE